MKNTKRALLSSAIVMLLCISMLVGTTFAWFTDSVSTGINKIESGNLDVELSYATPADYAEGKWTPVTSTTKIFKEGALYEPGYTELVYLKVENVGSLALKYDMNLNYTEKSGINVYGDEFKLSDYISARIIHYSEFSNMNLRENIPYFDIGWAQFEIGDVLSKFNESMSNTMSGWDETALEAGEETTVAVALWMDTEVGNDANYKKGTEAPYINLGIDLVATQYTSESDSFGKDYDADAEYPVVPSAGIADADEFENVTLTWDNYDQNKDATDTLDTAYKFNALETAEEAANSPYKYWNADFVVSFDKDVADGAVGLAGQYGAFEWIGFTNTGYEIKANEEIRLLASAGYYMNYMELCDDVKDFYCGAWAEDDSLKGTTITVELRLYETEAKNAETNNSHNNETEAYKVIDTVTYTF